MNEKNPLFVFGKLVDKIERLEELLHTEFHDLDEDGEPKHPFGREVWELFNFISADCDRLYSVLNAEFSPLHQFNTLAREQSNKYLNFTRDLINEKPESLR